MSRLEGQEAMMSKTAGKIRGPLHEATYNLESLSARFRSKCFRTETAFLIKWYKSSGMEGFKPARDDKSAYNANID
jgi:hypothetical protein